MQLQLNRVWESAGSTIGVLYVDGTIECFTLERPAVQIPEGTYPVNIRYSPKFNRDMPHIDDVPGREAIEIHWGNFPQNTEGCVLVGQTRMGITDIGDSVAAFNALFPKIETAQQAGDKITVMITHGGD